MDGLGAPHTLALDHLVVVVLTDGAGLPTQPHEVEVTAVTGAVRTAGRQVELPLPLLVHLTAQGDDCRPAKPTR